MTLLSLFMTSTGIFCFVPISQRLVESGIIPASNRWRFRMPSFVLIPKFYVQDEDSFQFLLPADKTEHTWSEAGIPPYSTDDPFATDEQPVIPCADDEWSTGTASPLMHPPINSLLKSPSLDTFYGHESSSFTSDTTLCDSCNTLLRQEIPPDHIPSVIRAFALFEARERLSGIDFGECEVVALTNAFSMLRL